MATIGSSLVKVALIGDRHVGKTSLISRYIENRFSHHYIYTEAHDIRERDLIINDRRVRVKLIDLAGHMYARSLIKSLYRDVQGVMVVFDVTVEESLDSLQEWLSQIEEVSANCPVIFLVGNKQDITSHRSVPPEQAEMKSQQFSLPYFETSAKTGHNVHETFGALVHSAWQKLSPSYISAENIKVSLASYSSQSSGNACCVTV